MQPKIWWSFFQPCSLTCGAEYEVLRLTIQYVRHGLLRLSADCSHSALAYERGDVYVPGPFMMEETILSE